MRLVGVALRRLAFLGLGLRNAWLAAGVSERYT